jgi:hypothetical protein
LASPSELFASPNELFAPPNELFASPRQALRFTQRELSAPKASRHRVQEGAAALYRGLAPRMLIYLTQGALFFAAYELAHCALAPRGQS